MKLIDTIILTYNEQIHIRRVIENSKLFSNNIYVIDSYSTDDTVKIANELGAVVFEHKWPGNQAAQFNWAIENLKLQSPWILRLDADEYLTDELVTEISEKLETIHSDINGIIFNRRTYFMGKWVKHGVYPVKLLRLFRNGYGYSENRWMDEHIKIKEGKMITFINDFIDDNHNNINWWITKHNNYAIREAINYFDNLYDICKKNNNEKQPYIGKQAYKKRKIKGIYYKLPIFFRTFIYFLYRYFIKLGFLDGKEGLIWAFLQGWWYRFLVDCHIFVIENKCGNNKDTIKEYIRKEFNIVL